MAKPKNNNTAVLEKPQAMASQVQEDPGTGVVSTPIEVEPGAVTELVSSVGDVENGDLEPAEADGGGSEPTAQPATVLIEVPVAPFDPKAHRSRFLTMRLTQRQADALKCIAAGLKQSHEMLRSEKHVDTPPQAVQWMLEQAATAIEQPAA